jgi:hypothetical protein
MKLLQLAVIGLFAFVGGLVAQSVNGVTAAPAGPKVITANQIELVDAQGRKRLSLGVMQDGGAYIAFLNEKGAIASAWSVDKAHQWISLCDPKGRESVLIESFADRSRIALLNPAGPNPFAVANVKGTAFVMANGEQIGRPIQKRPELARQPGVVLPPAMPEMPEPVLPPDSTTSDELRRISDALEEHNLHDQMPK